MKSFLEQDSFDNGNSNGNGAGADITAEAEEPLLRENPRRFVLFPIQDNEVSWGMTA